MFVAEWESLIECRQKRLGRVEDLDVGNNIKTNIPSRIGS